MATLDGNFNTFNKIGKEGKIKLFFYCRLGMRLEQEDVAGAWRRKIFSRREPFQNLQRAPGSWEDGNGLNTEFQTVLPWM